MNARARRRSRRAHVRRAFDYFRRVHALPARFALELARAEVWAYHAGAVAYIEEDTEIVTGFDAFPSGELREPFYYLSLFDRDSGEQPRPIEGHEARYWRADALADRRRHLHPRRFRVAS